MPLRVTATWKVFSGCPHFTCMASYVCCEFHPGPHSGLLSTVQLLTHLNRASASSHQIRSSSITNRKLVPKDEWTCVPHSYTVKHPHSSAQVLAKTTGLWQQGQYSSPQQASAECLMYAGTLLGSGPEHCERDTLGNKEPEEPTGGQILDLGGKPGNLYPRRKRVPPRLWA